MNKQNLWRMCCKSLARLKKASPTILTCVGAVGVLVTAVLAARAAPKAKEKIINFKSQRHEDERGEICARYFDEPTKLEKVQMTWTCYIPTAIAGTATIACIFGANALNRRQIVSLIGAYSMLNESYKRYREAAKEIYGEDADSKIIAEMAKKVYVSADGMGLYSRDEDKESEETLFYDSYSRRYFTSTLAAVINAEYHVNRNIQLRGYVPLNEFYDFLGIEKTVGSDNVGWYLDEMMEWGVMWLDFENAFTKLDDGLECYIITPMIFPTAEPDYDYA